VEIVGKNTSLYVQQRCGKRCFKLWCVLCAVHGTQYTPQLETYKQLRGSYRSSKTGYLYVGATMGFVYMRTGRKNMRTRHIKTPLGTDRLEDQRGHGMTRRRCTLGYFAVKMEGGGKRLGIVSNDLPCHQQRYWNYKLCYQEDVINLTCWRHFKQCSVTLLLNCYTYCIKLQYQD